jgi:hypothetical protein
MNVEKTRRFGIPTISSEALVGIGITIAGLGILCLLLGWAEHMRSLPALAWIWLALGGALLALGGIAAFFPRLQNRQQVRGDRSLPSDAPQAEAESADEPEEQRY